MKGRLSGILASLVLVSGSATRAQEQGWDKLMSDASAAAQSKQTAQSQQLYEKALAEAQKFGSKDPRLDKTLVTMATFYEAQKNWAKAESCSRQLVKVRAESLGPDHIGYAQTLSNLAVVLAQQGKNEESEQDYKKAMNIVDNALGPGNSYTATILENYAALLHKLNRTADAEKAEKQLSDIRKAERELIAAATPAESASASIGIASASSGRPGTIADDEEQAPASSTPAASGARLPKFFEQDVNEMLAMEGLYRQYMSTADKYAKPRTEIARTPEGRIKIDKGGVVRTGPKPDYPHAEKLYKMALEAAQLSSGPRSMETVLCMDALAKCYDEQEKYALAEPFFRRTVTIYAHMGEQNAWHFKGFADRYAECLDKLGKKELAAQVHEFVQHIDDWMNDPSSRNASYCAWLQQDKPPESSAFTSYQKDLERRIMANWTRPYGEAVAPPVVIFTLGPDGGLSHLQMKHTSESIAVDQAALKAVTRSAPFPALPPGTNFEVRVEFIFDGPGKCIVHHQ